VISSAPATLSTQVRTSTCRRHSSVTHPTLTDTDVSRLERAVTLRRGRLVEPCRDDWVQAERYRVECQYYVSVLNHLIQYFGARAEVGGRGQVRRTGARPEAAAEDVHRHLMVAYGPAGRDELGARG
jgi:hypothetical protein